MSKTGNHTLDTVTEQLGGTYGRVNDGEGCEAHLRNCFDQLIVEASGDTEHTAKRALVRKLRDCAKAILSDEWEFKS